MANAAPPDDGDAPEGGYGHAVVFFAALLSALASVLWYGWAVATGGDVLPALAVNATAVLVLVGLTAHTAYTDPDSAVTSLPGALGTALLLVGVYGLVASVVVGGTSPWHGRVDLAVGIGALAALSAVFGFFTFPAELLGGGDADGDRNGATEAGTADSADGE